MSNSSIRSGHTVVSDCAMGSELIGQGIAVVDIMRANLTHPASVRAIHQDNIVAGAQLITSNTFGPRSGREWVNEFRAGVEIAVQIAHESDREVGVWLSMTSFVVTLEVEALRAVLVSTPLRPLMLLLETCTSLAEARSAASAAASLQPDVLAVTAHFCADGNMPDGTTPEEFADTLARDGAQIVGANCGETPDMFIEITMRMRAAVDVPLLIQPSAGLPELDETGRWGYQLGAEEFATLAIRLAEAGANIVGGCCGTSHAHIAAACVQFARTKTQ